MQGLALNVGFVQVGHLVARVSVKCLTHSFNPTQKCFAYSTKLISAVFLSHCVHLQHDEDSDTFYCMLGYFGVPIVHLTLTWTTGSLTCVGDLFACVYARGTSVYSLI